MQDHAGWKLGRLPRAGGVEDQPARWVQAMQVCDNTIADQMIAAREKHKNKGK